MQSPKNTGIARARVLGLKGSPNFRDAGGYATTAGDPMRWGHVFRSGHLADLDPDDCQRFAELNIALVCDLRRQDEQRAEPSSLPANVDVISADITPGSQASVIYSDARKLAGPGAMFEFMCEINREFVASQSDSYRAVFDYLLESGADRVLFHCSAGKDRTGFAVAILHLALGVSSEDIEADYLLSRHYYKPEDQLDRVRAKYPVDHLSDAELMPMMITELDYLNSALRAMEDLHGSADRYLESGLGLGPAELRELRRRFLDPQKRR